MQTNVYTEQIRLLFGCDDTGAAIIAELYQYGELSYSRNKNYYIARYHSPLSRLKLVTDAVDRLEALGLIIHDRKPPGTRNRERQSSMIATDDLFDMMASIVRGEQLPPSSPRELIVLRNREKNLKPYKDSIRIRTMRNKLWAHGEAVMSAEIIADCELAPMVRIFNERFNRGGRAYSLWQNVPKLEREKFTMSGEPMVELDYRAIHPSLLYAEKKLPLPTDCYDIEGCKREHIKLALVILINAENLKSAVSALAAEIEDQERSRKGRPMLSKEENIPGYQLKEARRLIDAVKAHHKPISDSFHSGAGVYLQRIDSAIAEAVWWTMYNRGIVVLPVHDSFIVQASKADILEEMMIEASEKLGGAALTVTRSNGP